MAFVAAEGTRAEEMGGATGLDVDAGTSETSTAAAGAATLALLADRAGGFCCGGCGGGGGGGGDGEGTVSRAWRGNHAEVLGDMTAVTPASAAKFA